MNLFVSEIIPKKWSCRMPVAPPKRRCKEKPPNVDKFALSAEIRRKRKIVRTWQGENSTTNTHTLCSEKGTTGSYTTLPRTCRYMFSQLMLTSLSLRYLSLTPCDSLGNRSLVRNRRLTSEALDADQMNRYSEHPCLQFQNIDIFFLISKKKSSFLKIFKNYFTTEKIYLKFYQKFVLFFNLFVNISKSDILGWSLF